LNTEHNLQHFGILMLRI